MGELAASVFQREDFLKEESPGKELLHFSSFSLFQIVGGCLLTSLVTEADRLID